MKPLHNKTKSLANFILYLNLRETNCAISPVMPRKFIFKRVILHVCRDSYLWSSSTVHITLDSDQRLTSTERHLNVWHRRHLSSVGSESLFISRKVTRMPPGNYPLTLQLKTNVKGESAKVDQRFTLNYHNEHRRVRISTLTPINRKDSNAQKGVVLTKTECYWYNFVSPTISISSLFSPSSASVSVSESKSELKSETCYQGCDYRSLYFVAFANAGGGAPVAVNCHEMPDFEIVMTSPHQQRHFGDLSNLY
ncbi:hypothetical protein GQX74_002535 [Glossina fuscipes]|nr:hypothetical protein GQX74_002535 [Glossina fuscipes]